MEFIVLLAIALGLALDAFAVALAVGSHLKHVTARQYFRLSFHFGLFQALMPVLGWLAGEAVAPWAAAWDHWIACGLLSFVGVKMLWQSGREGDEKGVDDPTRGVSLVLLSIATSLDALAVGLTLALLSVRIALPALVTGLVAGALTLLGMRLGQRVGPALGRWAGPIGGVILIGIGVKIVLEHLFA